jgi:ubiquinone/menaquinone biosynthesis C-methylase UbiE
MHERYIKRYLRNMFWDKISPLYDLFENVYNHKVYSGTGKRVADFIESTDEVLECACGTGAISFFIAQKCKKLVATDFSSGMLKQASQIFHHFITRPTYSVCRIRII